MSIAISPRSGPFTHHLEATAEDRERWEMKYVRVIPVPLALGLLAGIACFLAAGTSLGFYLGGVTMLTILLPPLVAMQVDRLRAIVAAGAVFDGVGIAWFFAIFGHNASFVQWIEAYVILAAYAAFLLGVTWFVSRFTRPLAGSAIACVLSMLWLTWPIWLSPSLAGAGGTRATGWLTTLHPPMALNSVFRNLGVWVQTPFMYVHSTLGQDVPFELPRGVLACVGFHLLAGIALLAVARPRKVIEPLPELPLEWSTEAAGASTRPA
jgi:hypothetical protein